MRGARRDAGVLRRLVLFDARPQRQVQAEPAVLVRRQAGRAVLVLRVSHESSIVERLFEQDFRAAQRLE